MLPDGAAAASCSACIAQKGSSPFPVSTLLKPFSCATAIPAFGPHQAGLLRRASLRRASQVVLAESGRRDCSPYCKQSQKGGRSRWCASPVHHTCPCPSKTLVIDTQSAPSTGSDCNASCPEAGLTASCDVQLGKGKRNFSKLQRQVDSQKEKREMSERDRRELNEIKRLIPDRLSDPLLDVGMPIAWHCAVSGKILQTDCGMIVIADREIHLPLSNFHQSLRHYCS